MLGCRHPIGLLGGLCRPPPGRGAGSGPGWTPTPAADSLGAGSDGNKRARPSISLPSAVIHWLGKPNGSQGMCSSTCAGGALTVGTLQEGQRLRLRPRRHRRPLGQVDAAAAGQRALLRRPQQRRHASEVPQEVGPCAEEPRRRQYNYRGQDVGAAVVQQCAWVQPRLRRQLRQVVQEDCAGQAGQGTGKFGVCGSPAVGAESVGSSPCCLPQQRGQPSLPPRSIGQSSAQLSQLH